MTSQTIALGAPDILSESGVTWSGLAARLESGLAAGGATAYLRHFELLPGFGYVLLRLAATAAGDATAAGPELTSQMETSGSLTLAAGALTLTLPGPGAPGNAYVDADEPYYYDVPDADQALMQAWFYAYRALDAAARAGATLTLWDGEVDPPDTTVLPDLEPTFGAAAIDDQAYTRGAAIAPLVLPEAAGGDPPLVYSLAPLPAGLAFDPASHTLSGAPEAAGTATLTYTVTDADGDEATLEFDIVVAVPDLLPSFGAGDVADQAYVRGVGIAPLVLPEAAGGNAPLAYSLEPLPAGLEFDPAARTLSGAPAAVGAATLAYTVTDADGDTATLEFDIVVAADPDPDPELELADFDATGLETVVLALITAGPREDIYRAASNGGPVGTLHPGSDMTLRPGQDITRIRIWNNGADLRLWDNPSPETLSSFFGPGGAGADLTLHVQTAAGAETVSIGPAGGNYLNVEGEPAAFLDAIVEGTRFILAFTRPAPAPLPENRAPTADAGADQDAGHGAAVTLDGSASSDPDAGDAITFLWTQESGPTAALTGADTVRPAFTAPDLSTPSELVFTLVVSDAGGAMDTDTVTVRVAADLEPSFDAAAVADQAYVRGVGIAPLVLPEAADGDPPLTYALAPLPAGLAFDPASHTLSGAPEAAGTATLTYTVTDADGDTATLEFDIVVAPDLLPSFGAGDVADQAYVRGVGIAPLVLPEAAGGNAPLTYALEPLPAGLAFDVATRTLSGAPAAAGAATLTYTVTDADGDEATLEFDIVVAVPDLLPSFGAGDVADQAYVRGVGIAPLVLPEAAGGNAPLTYALEPLPAGLAFDVATRTLSGAPAAVGAATLTYTVTDADGDEATLEFDIVVAVPDLLPSFGAGDVADQAYVRGVWIAPLALPEAAGGDPPLTYALAPLPAGLAFDPAARTLSGAPAAVGAATLTYTVTDDDGDTATLEFDIVVAANPADAARYDRALRASAPEDAVLTALAIHHPVLLEPARLVNDAVSRMIEGNEYARSRFEMRRAGDVDGQAPRAELAIGNSGRDLMQWVEAADGGVGATVRMLQVLAAPGAAPEWEMTLDVLEVRADQEHLIVGLGYDPLLDRAAVLMRHDPQTSPRASTPSSRATSSTCIRPSTSGSATSRSRTWRSATRRSRTTTRSRPSGRGAAPSPSSPATSTPTTAPRSRTRTGSRAPPPTTPGASGSISPPGCSRSTRAPATR